MSYTEAAVERFFSLDGQVAGRALQLGVARQKLDTSLAPRLSGLQSSRNSRMPPVAIRSFKRPLQPGSFPKAKAR
jgi:hypothetical protein